nr:retrovirus-related Pol polyprotein from transposon TNT 1-94 [Tanacetum cinerariifolium]
MQVDCHLDKSQCAESKDDKAQAEYIATAEAAKEAVWIRKFVDELGVVPSNNYPIEMNCDNTTAISMVKEPGIM